MEVLCDAEVEKMWDKRVAQWKIEKMARQKLLQQVVESRRQQIQEKCGSHFLLFFRFSPRRCVSQPDVSVTCCLFIRLFVITRNLIQYTTTALIRRTADVMHLVAP